MQPLDLSELGKKVKNVVLLDLLVEIGDHEDPSLDCCIWEEVHLAGLGVYLPLIYYSPQLLT